MTSLTAMSTETAAPSDQQVRMGRLGPFFAAIWLFFLVNPLLEGWAHRDELRGVLGILVTLAFAAAYMAIWVRTRSDRAKLVGQPAAGSARSPTSPCSWSSAY